MANKFEQGNNFRLLVQIDDYLIIYKSTDVQKS